MTDLETEPLTFDWHAEQALDRDGLLVWLVITAMRQQDMERLSEVTSRFTDCRLTMQLNGVELNARAFLDGIARNLEHAAARQAQELAEVAGFAEIEDAVTEARDAVRALMTGRLRALGVPVGEEETGG